MPTLSGLTKDQVYNLMRKLDKASKATVIVNLISLRGDSNFTSLSVLTPLSTLLDEAAHID